MIDALGFAESVASDPFERAAITDRAVVDIDPFAQAAQEMATSALKAKMRAGEKRAAKSRLKVVQSEKDAPMKLSDQDQKLAEQSTQLRRYKAWQREQVKEHLQSRYADHWRTFARTLRDLRLDNPDELIAYVRGAGWLHKADIEVRQTALSLIAGAIIRLRLVNGYAPMDDSLLGEPPTVFEIIRAELRVLT